MRLVDADLMLKRNENSIYDTTDLKEMLHYEPTVIDTNKIIGQLENGIDEILYDRCCSHDYVMGMKEVRELMEKVFKGGENNNE